MKRWIILFLIVAVVAAQTACAEDRNSFLKGVGDWFSDAAGDVAEWTADAASDAWDWTTDAATDAWNWTTDNAADTWKWMSGVAIDAWDGVTGFFDPPSTEGNPSIIQEPELPDGTQKMYLGYQPTNTGLDNGYSQEREIGRDDPHFGLTLGKFYVSGFTSAVSEDKENFVFFKTLGDNVELHFELVQDINMLGGDTFVSINADDGGYDKYFGVSPTYFGRGTLIVRHTDYQNNVGTAQIYTDFLAGKMSGDADTVISLNEEGDYEVALDYEIKRDSYVLGTKITKTSYSDYRIFFRFSVRNGNCMVFPFDAITGEELKNTSATPNGFYLDLAYSRYLDIMVKRSVLNEQASGVTEDVRFNRPASDGEMYTQEGLYTIAARNRYTQEQTIKTIYVGDDERYIDYVAKGYSVQQIMQALEQ